MSGNTYFDPIEELKFLSDSHDLPESYPYIIQCIIEGKLTAEKLTEGVQSILSKLHIDASPEQIGLLSTWCCMEALSKSPSPETWEMVKNLQYYSWEIENWLHPVILEGARQAPQRQENFISLAKMVLLGNDQLFTQEITEDNQNQPPVQQRHDWEQKNNQLEALWRDLSAFNPMEYWRTSQWFEVLCELDIVEACLILSELKNPFLAQQLISRTAIDHESFDLSHWQKFVTMVDVAFDSSGEWNGNFIVPLLLVEARSQLLRIKGGYSLSTSEKSRNKKRIKDLAQEILKIIALRQDAIPLLKRWSAWLMFQLLAQGADKANELQSPAFIDSTLLLAMNNILDPKAITALKIPTDSINWEHWCYRACLSFWAQNNLPISLEYRSFLGEWDLLPDDWYETKGDVLRSHASYLTSAYNQTKFPGDLAYLLAYPLAQDADGVNDWCETWKSAAYLCELVEFSSENKKYEDRSKASELLFFLWQIGFALFDLKASQSKIAESVLARSLAELFDHLDSTVREMLIIVDTTNRTQWQQVIELLAVRRLLWEGESNNTSDEEGYIIFNQNDRPDFSDFLKTAARSEHELIALLGTALLNYSDLERIKVHISKANLDIESIIEKAQKLNQISKKHYPLNPQAVDKLSCLI